MNVNSQPPLKAEAIKKEVTLRTVLNIYGVLASIGLILSIFTHPISINANMQFVYYDRMDLTTIKEFLIFIFVASSIYFFLVNINFLGEKWRKLWVFTLILLSIFSIFMIFYLSL